MEGMLEVPPGFLSRATRPQLMPTSAAHVAARAAATPC